ncbi:uncharacterized protein B0T15DRAFT_53709 [Chaetomium strumarium]|uniref:Uncharacterized protein n=1 Tax=Chaetomium strumarium TaxID=1170767 RepID=A0AAJ0M6N3_9PEZI|nr:hypothetical protein B0T15DRAFT_53709 [Chaetomium strumarium]
MTGGRHRGVRKRAGKCERPANAERAGRAEEYLWERGTVFRRVSCRLVGSVCSDGTFSKPQAVGGRSDRILSPSLSSGPAQTLCMGKSSRANPCRAMIDSVRGCKQSAFTTSISCSTYLPTGMAEALSSSCMGNARARADAAKAQVMMMSRVHLYIPSSRGLTWRPGTFVTCGLNGCSGYGPCSFEKCGGVRERPCSHDLILLSFYKLRTGCGYKGERLLVV